jgi:hypothetical protein
VHVREHVALGDVPASGALAHDLGEVHDVVEAT